MALESVEYKLNEGVLIFIITTIIVLLVYTITKENIFSYIFIVYAVGIWRFDRTAVIFKRGEPKSLQTDTKPSVNLKKKSKK